MLALPLFSIVENDSIDFLEFCKLMKNHLKDPAQEEAELREAFSIFDKNGDGFVDASEIKSVIRGCGRYITDEDVAEIIRRADTNKDGLLNYEGTQLINYKFYLP